MKCTVQTRPTDFRQGMIRESYQLFTYINFYPTGSDDWLAVHFWRGLVMGFRELLSTLMTQNKE